ncbi:glutathionylspermidine synthase family protein [Pararhodobacter zhoushanensis]|uniref:glutathionylspermidine synthase family protein n=1 Tax=Pararhodobacter zhoushanensis TaxID=2479545 RepID=UPI000F8D8B3D|nr:glutathionylspermidine synthase family protein [Pararhodobacter zhoushanensis]
MDRIELGARPDWKEKARDAGFTFAEMHGEPYWSEESVYAFTLEQVERDIEDPSTELHAMCREAVERIVGSQELMERLAIPLEHRDLVAMSWATGDPELYGRFDLIYDGTGPAKMIEYNADTPTSLYESAAFQWQWLEDQIAAGVLPDDSDQFNGIHEALVARFAEIFDEGEHVHFTSFANAPEDYATTESMAWAAREAGLGAHYVPIDKIGLTDQGQFCDADAQVIGALFKLYPWEDMLRDDFATHIAGAHCRFLEPAWKAVVSNKGILAVLWEMFEGHPNLLPAFFAEDIERGGPRVDRAADLLSLGTVRKPIFSREGSSITIARGADTIAAAEDNRYGAHPMVVQAYQEITDFGGYHPVVGSWIVGEKCVGMGLREDRARITQDLSRFKPHFIRA